MEDNAERICPFCKAEVKEEDAVKVCSDCGTPHHEACWNENAGCAVTGCEKSQNDEQTNTTVCKKCGCPIIGDQKFCSKCGTPIGKREKKKGTLIGIIVALVAAIGIFAGFFAPKIFISVDRLCAQGNYEKAYAKATDEEKIKIKIENIAAVHCAVSVGYLKDPTAFTLKDVYYRESKTEKGKDSKQLVLFVSSYFTSQTISYYWLYVWDNEGEAWEVQTPIYDLTDEEYDFLRYSTDENLERLANNLIRESIRNTMSEGIKLSKEAVQRINDQFEAGTLENVKLLNLG